ncbi:FG-GAP repeat domain-containing protein [Guggenheimella bovis]
MKKMIPFALLLVISLITFRSAFLFDLDQDGKVELLLFTRFSPKRMIINDGVTFVQRNVEDLNIWKVTSGDIDHNGTLDLGLGVFKKSPYHQVMAKRLFYYTYKNGDILPLFRASRTSLPLEDFWTVSFSEKTRPVVKERTEDGKYVLSIYDWRGFGFYLIKRYGPYEDFAYEHLVLTTKDGKIINIDDK